jgi:thymidylate synthase
MTSGDDNDNDYIIKITDNNNNLNAGLISTVTGGITLLGTTITNDNQNMLPITTTSNCTNKSVEALLMESHQQRVAAAANNTNSLNILNQNQSTSESSSISGSPRSSSASSNMHSPNHHLIHMTNGNNIPSATTILNHINNLNNSNNTTAAANAKLISINQMINDSTASMSTNMNMSQNSGGSCSSSSCNNNNNNNNHQQQQQPLAKKPRLVFTDIQRRTLQAIFKETKRPSKEMQVTIAQQLGLEVATVSNFFMNARRRSMDKWKDQEQDMNENNNSNCSSLMA